MDQAVNKHRRLEIYLNNIKFKKINIGSLLAEEFIINSYHQSKINFFRNILVLIKYVLTIFPFKKNPPVESEYIITKSHNRFHYNALMDPIVIHYLNKATIICDENAFESSIR
ncbi:MAG TPA: hypothetical protein VGK38_04160, partial [Prolixibacteraceae bacterium]